MLEEAKATTGKDWGVMRRGTDNFPDLDEQEWKLSVGTKIDEEEMISFGGEIREKLLALEAFSLQNLHT